MRRTISVEYVLEDSEYERIVEIAARYKKQGLDLTPEKMFQSIMFTGSKYDIDDKLKFHEWKHGLRESYN